jgi:hypothetical protein
MGRRSDEALRMTLASANWGLKECPAGLASQGDMMGPAEGR